MGILFAGPKTRGWTQRTENADEGYEVTFYLEIQREPGIDRRAIRKLDDALAADGKCPGCGAQPFVLRLSGEHIHDRDTLRFNGRCAKCGDPVGYCYRRVETIFGLEEDRAVLAFGRARVYT